MAAVFAVGFSVGLKAWIVRWRISLKLCCFLLPNVCGGCACSGGSSGFSGVDCVLEDVSNTKLYQVVFCCLVCVAAVCAVGILVGLVAWIVLEDVSNTMLFSVP